MSYFDIFNGRLLYIMVIAAIVYMLGYCFITYRTTYNHAVELGFTKEKLKEITSSSIVFSIVPSLSIVIGLFSLSAVLGVPWAWFRLSVVGAVTYELMAADMVATGAGFESIGALAASGDGSLVPAIMFVMSGCICTGIICTLFFNKRFTKAISKANDSSPLGALIVSSLMLALAVNLPIQFSKGAVYIATMATSALVALVCRKLSAALHAKWIRDFEMAFCLILGMASSLVWLQVFGA